MAVVALDQKPGVTYPKGCFVWSPSTKSDAIPALLVYSTQTGRSGDCRSDAMCICAAESCQSKYKSKRSLRVERPGLYDVHVKYENGKSCVHQLEQITCNKDQNYIEVDGICRIKPKDIREVRQPLSMVVNIHACLQACKKATVSFSAKTLSVHIFVRMHACVFVSLHESRHMHTCTRMHTHAHACTLHQVAASDRQIWSNSISKSDELTVAFSDVNPVNTSNYEVKHCILLPFPILW